jgi:hypothetical protein
MEGFSVSSFGAVGVRLVAERRLGRTVSRSVGRDGCCQVGSEGEFDLDGGALVES